MPIFTRPGIMLFDITIAWPARWLPRFFIKDFIRAATGLMINAGGDLGTNWRLNHANRILFQIRLISNLQIPNGLLHFLAPGFDFLAHLPHTFLFRLRVLLRRFGGGGCFCVLFFIRWLIGGFRLLSRRRGWLPEF